MDVAGLVLAVFPIVVNGLSGFANAVGTIKVLHGYHREVARYARNFQVAQTVYVDTITELMADIAESDLELKELINDGGARLWKEPKYDAKLRARLDQSYNIYLEMIVDMLEALNEVRQKLGFAGDSNAELQGNKLRLLRELRRFKMAFNKQAYEEQLKRIERANNYLRETTHQNILLEPQRRRLKRYHSSRHTPASFRHLRQHARSLYRLVVTGKSWKCNCRKQHLVKLNLTSAELSKQKLEPSTPQMLVLQISIDGAAHRHMTGTSPTMSPCNIWRAIEVHSTDFHLDPQSEVPSVPTRPTSLFTKRNVSFADTGEPNASTVDRPTKGKLIEDLCSALRGLHRSDTPFREDLGYLQEEEDRTYQHQIFSITGAYEEGFKSCSLEDLLHLQARLQTHTKIVLSRKQRLKIAAGLALNAFYLDGSWFKKHWRSKDILFPGDSKTKTKQEFEDMSYEQAFVQVQVDDTNNESDCRADEMTKTMSSHRIRSEMLFALAISLIELSCGKPMQDLKESEDADRNEVLSNLKAASRLLQTVYDESGQVYGDVLRRCLDCPFDVNVASLDNARFQEAVFECIVTPLFKNLEMF